MPSLGVCINNAIGSKTIFARKGEFSMKCNELFCRIFLIAVIALSAEVISPAQCISANPTTLYYTNYVVRAGGNDIWTYAGSHVEGDYYYNWYTSVTMTEYKNGFVFQGRQNIFNDDDQGGYPFMITYHDAPSVHGPGVYALQTFHEFDCFYEVSYYDFVQPPVEYLTVQKPSVNNYGIQGVWWLGGAGMSDPNNGYYNVAVLGANKNCNPGDFCNETPSWSITQGASRVSMSSSTGSSINLTAVQPSVSVGDVQVVFNIGGFYSDPLPFTVNRPYKLGSAGAPYDAPFNDGYVSYIYYYSYDRFNNLMPSIALNEQFGTWLNDDPSNNWAKPTAFGVSGYPPDSVSQHYWYDQIYHHQCSACIPPVLHPQSPLTGNLIDKAPQTWRLGSSTVGSGASVQTNVLQRYQDHGRHVQPIVTPSVP
jgi:hypothetical protein